MKRDLVQTIADIAPFMKLELVEELVISGDRLVSKVVC
jgi:hypothetical protein